MERDIADLLFRGGKRMPPHVWDYSTHINTVSLVKPITNPYSRWSDCLTSAGISGGGSHSRILVSREKSVNFSE